MGAMRTAEELSVRLHAVAHDLAMAMAALGRERVDRTFEAVERVGLAVLNHLERFVVVVSADFARGHDVSSLWPPLQRRVLRHAQVRFLQRLFHVGFRIGDGVYRRDPIRNSKAVESFGLAGNQTAEERPENTCGDRRCESGFE
jgi:hypothetical protein